MVHPETIKRQVAHRVQWCLQKATERYGHDYPFPTIDYGLRGTTAGRADRRSWTVYINLGLLLENVEDMIENTVPHEVAHLIADDLDYRAGVYFTRKPHGWRWQNVMHTFGLDPTRCHNYDTTNVKIKKAPKPKFIWVCSGCGAQMVLGPKRHRNMMSGVRIYWKRGCAHHGGFHYSAPKVQLTNGTSNYLSKGMTKKDMSFQIYLESASAGRAAVIHRYKTELDMSDAGASTYYQNAKKHFGH